MADEVTKDGTEEATVETPTPVVEPKVVEQPVVKDTSGDNLVELRKAKDEADLRVAKAKEEADNQVKEANEKLADRDRQDALRDIVGDDDDMRAKVMEEYGVLNMPDTTPEEVKARMEKANKLAQPVPDTMGHEVVSSSGGSARPSQAKGTPAPEVAEKFGVSEDDIKKLTPDVEAMRERRKNG